MGAASNVRNEVAAGALYYSYFNDSNGVSRSAVARLEVAKPEPSVGLTSASLTVARANEV